MTTSSSWIADEIRMSLENKSVNESGQEPPNVASKEENLFYEINRKLELMIYVSNV